MSPSVGFHTQSSIIEHLDTFVNERQDLMGWVSQGIVKGNVSRL